MNKFYVTCDLGAAHGRVMLGLLHQDKLTVSEVRRFQNQPVQTKNSVHWNIPELYQETIDGLRQVSRYEEPIDGISCSSWAGDYLLFGSDGSLITPTHHHSDPRGEAGMEAVLSKLPAKAIYEETGVQIRAANTLSQLGAENSRRLKQAQLLPIADGFNYLLSGVPRVELSMASATQLYNPVTRNWSEQLVKTLNLPPTLLPQIVPAGTKLGPLRPEVAKETGLADASVIAAGSDAMSAALAGLSAPEGEHWAFLRPGSWTIMGTHLAGPIITDESREMNFTNEIGFGGSVRFSKRLAGTWILEECRRGWKGTERDHDDDVLRHLATSAPSFESLINPADPRFHTSGDMPQKIQQFCKETGQTVPRRPGPIIRCVTESLALQYRQTLDEIAQLTGREISRLFVLGRARSDLLNHFTANALNLPVFIAPAEATVIGNMMIQALALGHVKSICQAREVVGNSFPMESIIPRSSAWDAAYERFVQLASP